MSQRTCVGRAALLPVKGHTSQRSCINDPASDTTFCMVACFHFLVHKIWKISFFKIDHSDQARWLTSIILATWKVEIWEDWGWQWLDVPVIPAMNKYEESRSNTGIKQDPISKIATANTCPASAKLWVPPPVLQKKKKRKEKRRSMLNGHLLHGQTSQQIYNTLLMLVYYKQ
jgi:hypothetical protein